MLARSKTLRKVAYFTQHRFQAQFQVFHGVLLVEIVV